MADLIEATVALKIEDTLSMKIERFTWAKVGRLSNLGWDHTPLLLSQIWRKEKFESNNTWFVDPIVNVLASLIVDP